VDPGQGGGWHSVGVGHEVDERAQGDNLERLES
jgi:hypothetical protein